MADNDFFNENFDDIFGDLGDSAVKKNEKPTDEILKEGAFDFETSSLDNNSGENTFGDMSELDLDLGELDFDEEVDNDKKEEVEEVEKKEKKKININIKDKLPEGGIKGIFNSLKEHIKSYKDIKNFDEKRFKRLLMVILFLFVALVTTVMVLRSKMLKSKVEEDIVKITQNDFVANLPSYIYVNQDIVIDGKSVLLKKILVDVESTFLFFDMEETITNFGEFSLFIVDENNKFYGTKSDEVIVSTNETVVPLKRLNEGIEEFTLHIVSVYSGEEVVIPFKSDKELKVPYGKYTNSIVSIKDPDSDIALSLLNSVFSPAYSTLNFLLESDEESGYEYILGSENVQEKINLYENGKKVLSIAASDSHTTIDDVETEIIKIEYNPVKNLSSKIEIEIPEIFKSFSIDKVFQTRELFLKEIKDYHTIKVDNYDINLEGMKRYDDKIVLVAHAIDTDYYNRTYPVVEVVKSKNIYDPIVEPPEPPVVDKTDGADRVEVYLDCTLLVHKEGETPFELTGEIMTSKEGTDILFTDERLIDTTSKDYDVRIDNVRFKQSNYSIQLDLKELDTELEEEISSKIEFVETSMINRLRYKSSELVNSSVKGFSNEILNDSGIMNFYTPTEVLKPARYDVLVTSYIYRNDNFIFIVDEQWHGVTKKGVENYVISHEIRVGEVDGELQIIKDEILENNYNQKRTLE